MTICIDQNTDGYKRPELVVHVPLSPERLHLLLLRLHPLHHHYRRRCPLVLSVCRHKCCAKTCKRKWFVLLFSDRSVAHDGAADTYTWPLGHQMSARWRCGLSCERDCILLRRFRQLHRSTVLEVFLKPENLRRQAWKSTRRCSRAASVFSIAKKNKLQITADWIILLAKFVKFVETFFYFIPTTINHSLLISCADYFTNYWLIFRKYVNKYIFFI